ncbi:hypothetical protein GW17_00022557 [Ensete ventricosum]|nr:hypothetical protein GW17_00022557 [Ensete ventricosum]
MSLGASDLILGGCVSTSPTLDMQWSLSLSSSFWTSLSPPPHTSFSPCNILYFQNICSDLF